MGQTPRIDVKVEACRAIAIIDEQAKGFSGVIPEEVADSVAWAVAIQNASIPELKFWVAFCRNLWVAGYRKGASETETKLKAGHG